MAVSFSGDPEGYTFLWSLGLVAAYSWMFEIGNLPFLEFRREVP